MEFIARAYEWTSRHPWGIVVAYVVLLIGSYLTIWSFIEPADVPANFESAPWVLRHRLFYHVLGAMLVASHALVVMLLLKSIPAGLPQIASAKILERLELSHNSTNLESCWKPIEGSPRLKRLPDGYYGDTVSLQGRFEDAVEYRVSPKAKDAKKVHYTAIPAEGFAFYLMVNIVSADRQVRRDVFISITPNKMVPAPHGNGDTEWTIWVPPKNLEGQWQRYDIEIARVVKDTFGQKGWRYNQLVGFKIRGSMRLKNIILE